MRIGSILLFGLSMLGGCANPMTTQYSSSTPTPEGSKALYVAGGCFWCLDAQYRLLKGVSDVVSGYAGGTVPNPSYEDVCSGATGHAETVKVVYDPKKITEADLLRIFFTIHDPTTLNRQGPDEGTQYRSAIFYQTEQEKALAEQVIAEIGREKIWKGKIVTSLEPLKAFYPAEDYHQNYFDKFEKAGAIQRAGMNSGYCTVVVEPKVRKFREKFAKLLK